MTDSKFQLSPLQVILRQLFQGCQKKVRNSILQLYDLSNKCGTLTYLHEL